MLKGYVINLNRHPERLRAFYQQEEARAFQRLPAVDKQILTLLPSQFVFNTEKLANIIRREVTLGEIGCTLSHIECWRKIAEDNQINDDDFVLVAEDDVRFHSDFSANVALIVDYTKPLENISLIILQKLGLFGSDWNKPAENSAIQLIEPQNTVTCDNDGSALYAIRKSHAKQLIASLQTEKPFWLADQFSFFTPLSAIRIAYPLSGFVPENAESDLEAERNIARQNRTRSL